MAESLDHSLERSQYHIPPETEFWGHCSNLQIWNENGYNSKLLHRNLAFPLLKKLTEVGDPLAIKVFKEEIAKRIDTGIFSVVMYLVEEGYMNYLNREELLSCLLEEIDAELILVLEKEIGYQLDISLNFEAYSSSETVLIENKKVIGINITLDDRKSNVEDLFSLLSKFAELSLLAIQKSNLKYVPSTIGLLKKLEYLTLCYDNITKIPDEIGYLSNLEQLNLEGNYLNMLPKSLSNLDKLETLNLSRNNLNEIPTTILSFKNLYELNLSHNRIMIVPLSIKNLTSLYTLNLEDNLISKIPKELGQIIRLKRIYLSKNPINKPNEIKNMLKKEEKIRYVDI